MKGNGPYILIFKIDTGNLVIIHICYLSLNNLMHISHAATNLLSIHNLCADNHVFVKFHRDIFYVKDQTTRKVVLQGRSI